MGWFENLLLSFLGSWLVSFIPPIRQKIFPGNLLNNPGRYPKAEKEYREAIRINPDDADAHYNLGNLLYKQGRYEEARAELEKAARLFEAQGQRELAEKARGILEGLPK